VILLLAVLAGLLAGAVRAWARKRRYQPIHLNHAWLVIGAFLPQWLAFYLPATRSIISDQLAAILLVASQALMLAFVWINRDKSGFLVLGLGLAVNLVVIFANRGLMPISPETATRLVPSVAPEAWQTGERFGWSKDIILPVESTQFWQLSDRLISPAWSSYQFVFSLGDVLIALGAFWVFWEQGGSQKS
jgi:hypothetical protein